MTTLGDAAKVGGSGGTHRNGWEWGSNGYGLLANSGATYGVDWEGPITKTIRERDIGAWDERDLIRRVCLGCHNGGDWNSHNRRYPG